MVSVSVGSRTLARVRREAERNGFDREKLPSLTLSLTGQNNGKKRDPRDLVTLGEVFTGYYAQGSVAKRLVFPQIVEAWESIVGSVVAEHTIPKALTDEVLTVEADSTVWAAQLSALGQLLVTKINTTVGSRAVTRIKVNGPKAKVPNYGPRTVKGRVGYRDTFG